MNFTVPSYHIATFKEIINTLKKRINKINIVCHPITDKADGCVQFKSVDKMGLTLINLKLNASELKDFSCPSKILLGVRLNQIHKIISFVAKSDDLKFSVDANQPDILKISIINIIDENKLTIVSLKLIELPKVTSNFMIKCDATIRIDTGVFSKILEKNDGDFIKFKVYENMLIIKLGNYNKVFEDCDLIHSDNFNNAPYVKSICNFNDLKSFKNFINVRMNLITDLYLTKSNGFAITSTLGTLATAMIYFVPKLDLIKNLQNSGIVINKNLTNVQDSIEIPRPTKQKSPQGGPDNDSKNDLIQEPQSIQSSTQPDLDERNLSILDIGRRCSFNFLKQISSEECEKNPNLIQFIEDASTHELRIKSILSQVFDDPAIFSSICKVLNDYLTRTFESDGTKKYC